MPPLLVPERRARRVHRDGRRAHIIAHGRPVGSATLAACAGSRSPSLAGLALRRAAARATSRRVGRPGLQARGRAGAARRRSTAGERAAGRRREAFEKRMARAARATRRGEQVGLVVRALPLRVPLLPEARPPSAARRSRSSASTRTTTTATPRISCEYPVPFPSYKDPDLEVAAAFNGVQAFPTTAFYDREGRPGLRAPGRLRQRAEAGRGHRALRSLTLDVRTARTEAGAGRRARPARARLLRRAGRLARGRPRRPRPRGHAHRGARGRTGDRHLPAAVPRRRGAAGPARGRAGRSAAAGGRRHPGARPTACRAAAGAERISLHAQTYALDLYVRDGYARARRALRGGGHRARGDGEAPCLSSASTR